MRLPNTPVPNPLTRGERELARSTLFKIAHIFKGTEFDPTLDLSREDQARTVRRVVDEALRAASALGADMVGFEEAACARTELDAYAEAIEGERLETLRTLWTIAARLNDACERAIPERLAALEQVRAHERVECGFAIQAVLGQGEPFAVPPFAYTVGLEELGHPELVIVGLNHQQAGAVLAPLAQRIVVGEVIEPGPISNALEAGLTLRAVECPSVLRQALRAATWPGRRPAHCRSSGPTRAGASPVISASTPPWSARRSSPGRGMTNKELAAVLIDAGHETAGDAVRSGLPLDTVLVQLLRRANGNVGVAFMFVADELAERRTVHYDAERAADREARVACERTQLIAAVRQRAGRQP